MRKLVAPVLCFLIAAALAGAQDISNPQTNASALTTGTLPAGRMPALTGDVTSSAGGVATTLAAGNASNLNSGTLAAARGGAGAVNGALAGNGSGAVSQAACAGLSNAAASCSTDATNATNITSGTLPIARMSMTPITASLGSNVALTNGSNVDGPSVAQGTSGTWWASGTVTWTDSVGALNMKCKLYDGATVIDSSDTNATIAANGFGSMSLSGFIVSPAGNIRIGCTTNTTTSTYAFNASGFSKDCTVSAFRIN